MKKISLLKLITFLSAFLLFQIELIIAKTLLPNYGGSYMVWGACIVFFQAALLAGYYFSHVILSRLGISKYLILHLVLLLVPLLFFPGRALLLSAEHKSTFLAMDVFRELLITIGPVFFMLATMSMVTQVWLANSELTEKKNPHILYAWSNMGSFAALLSYPFIFEYLFDLSSQLAIWRTGYALLIALNVMGWFLIAGKTPSPVSEEQPANNPLKTNFTRCFMLSTGGVMIFLAVTNIITVQIAAIPLIWIIPLGIYLLSFVLNFKERPWYPSRIGRNIHVVTGLSILLFFMAGQQTLPVMIGAIGILVLLFFTCMYCQHELLGLRPADHRRLTAFYLVISLGGFTGGLLTTWIIPLISNLLLEYLLALLIISLTFAPSLLQKNSKKNTILEVSLVVLFILLMSFWPRIFPKNSFLLMMLIAGSIYVIFSYFKNIKHATTISLLLMIVLSGFLEASWTGRNFIYKKRNFYGIYQVYNTGRIRRFRHGATLHGAQIQDPQLPQNQLIATSYYGANSPVATIMGVNDPFHLHHIGVIGLGAGTLATYLKPDQRIDFYELDPEVHDIATRYFTFLTTTHGKTNFFIGDGRLNLKNRPGLKYDVLIVDAFNGDNVPYHLLTREMIGLCKQHLNPGGILLFHLSNRYFKLEQVLSRIAADMGTNACYKFGTDIVPNVEEASLWGALTWDANVQKKLVTDLDWSYEDFQEYAGLRPWTDQYSSTLPIIKYGDLMSSLFSW